MGDSLSYLDNLLVFNIFREILDVNFTINLRRTLAREFICRFYHILYILGFIIYVLSIHIYIHTYIHIFQGYSNKNLHFPHINSYFQNYLWN